MPINESFTDVSDVSIVANPGSMVSDSVVDGDFKGEIFLELLRPGSTQWMPVYKTTGKKSTPLNTPDSAISYRFRLVNIVGTANVYFGP